MPSNDHPAASRDLPVSSARMNVWMRSNPISRAILAVAEYRNEQAFLCPFVTILVTSAMRY